MSHRSKLVDLFAIDLRSLAAFRIAIASLILYDLVARAPFIATNYTSRGVLPTSILDRFDRFLSLRIVCDTVASQSVLFLLAGVFAAMLLVGWRTRLATSMTWFFVCSLHARNSFLLNGGDDLLRALLLWSIFLPLGDTWSLDARRKGQVAARGSTVCSIATVALFLQFVFFYVSAGIAKLTPEWLSSGTAIELALGQKYWVRSFGEFLAQYPQWLSVLTPTVVSFELIAPLLLFIPVCTSRTRLLLIAGFWMLQLGLGLSMQLILFPWVSTIATLPLVPSSFWNTISKWTSGVLENTDCRSTSTIANRNPSGTAQSLPTRHQVVVGFLMGYVILSSVLIHLTSRFWDYQRMGHMLGLVNGWTMYARPSEYSIDFDVVVTLPENNVFDPFDSQYMEKNWPAGKIHENDRFKNYLQHSTPKKKYSRSYMAWLTRQMLTGHAPIRKLQRFFVSTRILPRGQPVQVLVEEVRFAGGRARYIRHWKPGARNRTHRLSMSR